MRWINCVTRHTDFRENRPLLYRASAIVLMMAMAVPTAVFGDDSPGPAVESPNGKVSIEGGQSGGDDSFLGLGSYTTPLGSSTGLQFDGAFGYIDEEIMGGGGVHLFARDPSSYLLGFYGSYHQWNDIEIWRAAGEFEFYNGQFSLSGLAGIESVDIPTGSDSQHFFGQADLSFYATDNLVLSGGYHYLNETSLGAVGVEYLMQGQTPISLFAHGRFGENDYQQASGGMKVYFDAGPARSLIDRHRVMDPPNYTPIFPVNGVAICESSTFFDEPDCICGSETVRAGSPPQARFGSKGLVGYSCSFSD